MKINNNIAKIYKLSAYKNLNLWDFTREMEVLDRFRKKGNSKMDDQKTATAQKPVVGRRLPESKSPLALQGQRNQRTRAAPGAVGRSK